MAHSLKKLGGYSHSSCPFTCLRLCHGCSDQGGEEVIKWLATEV